MDVLFDQISGKEGVVGVITLNRPDALNALTHGMCHQMGVTLREWGSSEDIKAVAIQGAGEKAFCAGGDIRYLYELAKSGDIAKTQQFFWDEYRLNYLIQSFPKPFLSFMDGIAMGGGVGVSVHGTHRVATDHTRFGMPETGIGFFPDIGGSYFLSRCRGELGTYLGLTGNIINAADLIFCELADHFISSVHLDDIVQQIADTNLGEEPKQRVTNIIKEFEVSSESPELLGLRHVIDECFKYDTVEEIIANLVKQQKPWADDVIAKLGTRSPTSLKVTLRELREGVSLDFKGCMQMEYRICQGFILGNDFYEGIRAAIIEKDNQPNWVPGVLEDVTDEMVDAYFEPLAVGELSFDEE